ncbi:hypothetical protein AUR04nite_31170 [Glutamicibacter uratoxydans]|uniref:YCII-related domain-containing protein n=1 Tax=Glutamicibacter uratoxydans TaxID=43667 RepID=A0A4Y4DVF4_GLUUR|nr:hypothetical protein [Glutamicibacter uratoxydans]GED07585.1 hypothetical protein AUR04nite_31170 [Glutamicibacter uratoxydans]
MTQYIIYFHQQWVGQHSDEWFASRGPLANAVIEQAKAEGILVAAAGVEEDLDRAVAVDATSGSPQFSSGLVAPGQQYLGGLTIIDVENEEAARMWAGKIAEACGWPQQLRRLY